MSDGEVRRLGERNGLDTHVALAVNDVDLGVAFPLRIGSAVA